MKHPWAILLAATIAMGCRSSQPTTNPFMRTTVPPPATGQGAVVVPGEPYYPGATAPPAGAAPPPIAAPGTPVAPPPTTPPPVIAPPPAATPVMPPVRDNKYSPPGGSYQYNQSSLERSKARPNDVGATEDDATELAAGDEPDTGATDRPREIKLPSIGNAVEQALALGSEPDSVSPASYETSDAPQTPVAARSGSRWARTTANRPLKNSSTSSAMRVVGQATDSQSAPESEDADATKPAQLPTTLRITAGKATQSAAADSPAEVTMASRSGVASPASPATTALDDTPSDEPAGG